MAWKATDWLEGPRAYIKKSQSREENLESLVGNVQENLLRIADDLKEVLGEMRYGYEGRGLIDKKQAKEIIKYAAEFFKEAQKFI